MKISTFSNKIPLGYLENFFATVVALKAAEGTLAVGIQNIQKKQGDMVTPNLLRQVVKGQKPSKDQIKQLCHAMA